MVVKGFSRCFQTYAKLVLVAVLAFILNATSDKGFHSGSGGNPSCGAASTDRHAVPVPLP
jgi:hypothetical protein